MVAIPGTITPLDSFVLPPYPVRRFSVEEYRSLVESGVLEEDDRIELLEGWIVPKMTHNPPHDWTVTHLANMLRASLSDNWIIRIQCALNTTDSEPEPDVAIVKGPNDRYLNRHPTGDDTELVIEVADTSLEKDRRKAGIYASAGVPVYWIVNLADRVVEVFRGPESSTRSYRDQQIVKIGDQLEIPLNQSTRRQIPVADILPPAN